jgi:hypothetical protein
MISDKIFDVFIIVIIYGFIQFLYLSILLLGVFFFVFRCKKLFFCNYWYTLQMNPVMTFQLGTKYFILLRIQLEKKNEENITMVVFLCCISVSGKKNK